MIKNILILCLGLFFSVNIDAQSRWGIKAGVNLSEINTKVRAYKVDGTNVRFGFHAGLMFEYDIIPAFVLQHELLFIQNGTSTDAEAGEYNRKNTTTINQLQLPINLKYNLGLDNLRLFITTGPYIGYGLSAKREISGENTSVDLYNENLKRFDFGVGIGAGINLRHFIFGINYQHGIINLSKIYDIKYKMRTLQLSLGYLF